MDQIEDCASLFPKLDGNMAAWKVVEEIGEVADAFIGISGVNDRKGFYATRSDLRTEMLDVALTAMIAWVKLCEEHGIGQTIDAAVRLEEHARERAARHRAKVAGARAGQ